jgi:broad specificity phosphatase PhoE
MSRTLPTIYLVRHGETAWSLSGQHTGSTDLPLTEHGEREAAALSKRLAGLPVAAVFTSPLRRAKQTCALAGFEFNAEEDPDLVEWDYGDYEGLRTAEIHTKRPGWQLFRDGCPGGESPAQVAARAERVLDHARGASGNVLIFSSGHFLRMLAARWLGLEPIAGMYFNSGTASVSALGFENTLDHPVIQAWNNTTTLNI